MRRRRRSSPSPKTSPRSEESSAWTFRVETVSAIVFSNNETSSYFRDFGCVWSIIFSADKATRCQIQRLLLRWWILRIAIMSLPRDLLLNSDHGRRRVPTTFVSTTPPSFCVVLKKWLELIDLLLFLSRRYIIISILHFRMKPQNHWTSLRQDRSSYNRNERGETLQMTRPENRYPQQHRARAEREIYILKWVCTPVWPVKSCQMSVKVAPKGFL